MRNIKKEYICTLIVLFIILAIGSGLFFQNRREDEDVSAGFSSFEDNSGKSSENFNIDSEEEKKIFVHIAGEVKEPGVYEVEKDSRIFEVVELAGGETSEADLISINLAARLNDGQKIIIPQKRTEGEGNIDDIKDDDIDTSFYTEKYSDPTSKININQADMRELQHLTGIGPSKAESIISYREDNKEFNNKNELLEVSGIGQVTLENIKDDITLW